MTLSDFTTLASATGSIVSVIFAFVALNISYKTFKRQQTFENENHYYEYKFNTYTNILKKMVDYLNFVDDKVFDTYDKFKHKEITIEDLEKSADEIDNKTDNLSNELGSLVAFLPRNIIEQIDKALDVIYNNNLGEEKNEVEYANTQKVLNKITDEMDMVEKLMIKDIGLDIIHKRLKRRTDEI